MIQLQVQRGDAVMLVRLFHREIKRRIDRQRRKPFNPAPGRENADIQEAKALRRLLDQMQAQGLRT